MNDLDTAIRLKAFAFLENLGLQYGTALPREVLAEAGQLADGCIRYSPDLLEIFRRFFEVVSAGNDKCTPFNPFFHLRSEGFWRLNAQVGKDSILEATRTIRGSGQLMELVSHASLDPQLLALLAVFRGNEQEPREEYETDTDSRSVINHG